MIQTEHKATLRAVPKRMEVTVDEALAGVVYMGKVVEFQYLLNKAWFIFDGDVCVKVKQLNGCNVFNFTDCSMTYIEKWQKVQMTVPPVHPLSGGPVKIWQTIHFFDNGTYGIERTG